MVIEGDGRKKERKSKDGEEHVGETKGFCPCPVAAGTD